MHYSSVLAAAAAMCGLASAQTSSITIITPASVPQAERNSWCDAERNTCPEICGASGTTSNSCDPNLLTYSCTCRDNVARNISDYSQTLPFFACQAGIDQCVSSNVGNATGQSACRTVTCGSRNASVATTTTTSSAAASSTSATAAASTSATGTTSSPSATASKSSADMGLSVGGQFGSGFLVAGLMAVFGFAM